MKKINLGDLCQKKVLCLPTPREGELDKTPLNINISKNCLVNNFYFILWMLWSKNYAQFLIPLWVLFFFSNYSKSDVLAHLQWKFWEKIYNASKGCLYVSLGGRFYYFYFLWVSTSFGTLSEFYNAYNAKLVLLYFIIKAYMKTHMYHYRDL